MNLDIKTIPHGQQRYDTVGDYWEEEDKVFFRISEFQDRRYEWLVLIHELVEYSLVKAKGISIKQIDEFDMAFENRRPTGNMEEPGDDPTAPYYFQHQMATTVERVLAVVMGVDWAAYDAACKSL